MHKIVLMAQQKSKVNTGNQNIGNGAAESKLLFGKKNYIFLLAGMALIFLGFLLMAGGHMPSPEVWDESLIYSFRRITLAPIVILSGLIVSGISIFIKN